MSRLCRVRCSSRSCCLCRVCSWSEDRNLITIVLISTSAVVCVWLLVWRWSRLISLIAWQFLIGAVVVVLVWDGVLLPRGVLLARRVLALFGAVGRLTIRVSSAFLLAVRTHIIRLPLRRRLRGSEVSGLWWRIGLFPWSRVGAGVCVSESRVACRSSCMSFRGLPRVRVVPG